MNINVHNVNDNDRWDKNLLPSDNFITIKSSFFEQGSF